MTAVEQRLGTGQWVSMTLEILQRMVLVITYHKFLFFHFSKCTTCVSTLRDLCSTSICLYCISMQAELITESPIRVYLPAHQQHEARQSPEFLY